MTRNTLKAKTGDIVMCRNDHPLYELKGDVYASGIILSAMFKPIGNAQQPGPAVGIKNCHICGEPWITKGPNGGYLLCNVRDGFVHELIETTIQNRASHLADTTRYSMNEILYGPKSPPPTRWEAFYGLWRRQWWRIRDAWQVLTGKADIE